MKRAETKTESESKLALKRVWHPPTMTKIENHETQGKDFYWYTEMGPMYAPS